MLYMCWLPSHYSTFSDDIHHCCQIDFYTFLHHIYGWNVLGFISAIFMDLYRGLGYGQWGPATTRGRDPGEGLHSGRKGNRPQRVNVDPKMSMMSINLAVDIRRQVNMIWDSWILNLFGHRQACCFRQVYLPSLLPRQTLRRTVT